MRSPFIPAVIAAFALSACASLMPSPEPAVEAPPPPPPSASAPATATQPVVAPVRKPVRIGLALGGGAARGFAHIGVIKVLEAQGLAPDLVVGTSAGAVVGALYASGSTGFELQKMAFKLEESKISDWSMPDRGVFKGEALQQFVNNAVAQRSIESLKKPLGVTATDLHSGEGVLFRTGNTGMAVRASATVPGVFQPVSINSHEYVDGGLSSLVPVRGARQMGATVVIAVDISARPDRRTVRGTLDILLQTFTIMGQNLARHELEEADVVIRPQVGGLGPTDFQARHDAILEGEKAAQAALPAIREAIRKAAGA